MAVINDKADSVGADIDNGLTDRVHLRRTRLSVGTFLSSAKAPPLPESEALVMKEWCRLNGIDRDRLQNVQSGIVKATVEEIEKITKYAEG